MGVEGTIDGHHDPTQNDPDNITIAGYFADVPPAILAAASARYKARGIWGTTPILPRAGYDRLRDGLVSGGFVSPGATFETAVENTLAEDVIARGLPALV